MVVVKGNKVISALGLAIVKLLCAGVAGSLSALVLVVPGLVMLS